MESGKKGNASIQEGKPRGPKNTRKETPIDITARTGKIGDPSF